MTMNVTELSIWMLTNVYSVNTPVHQMHHVATQSVVIIAIVVMDTAKMVQHD